MAEAGRPRIGALKFKSLAPIAVGSTARVDLCRLIEPVDDKAPAGMLLAVKRLLPEVAGDIKTAKRFLDEVWMTAALNHPNVVRVVGWGEDAEGAFLGVELVQGVSLARLLKTVVETGEEFPDRLVVYAGSCIARGLAAAHALKSDKGELLGLVHRDLSLGNILVGFNGDIKIADFGLAKAKDRLSHTTTGLSDRFTGHVAPEELLNQPVDHRADIFSFGVILYELLTGRPPFSGVDEVDTAKRVLKSPPASLAREKRRVDPALIRLVEACLAKSPEERPKNAGEIVNVCEDWLVLRGKDIDTLESMSRFVRRNAMKQMRWFERMIQSDGQQGAGGLSKPRKLELTRPFSASSQSPSSNGIAGKPKPNPVRDDETAVDGHGVQQPAEVPRPARRSNPNLRRRRESTPELPLQPQFSPDDEAEDIPTIALPWNEVAASMEEALPSLAEPSESDIVHEIARLSQFASRASDHARALRYAAQRAELDANRAAHAAKLGQDAEVALRRDGVETAKHLLLQARTLIASGRDRS